MTFVFLSVFLIIQGLAEKIQLFIPTLIALNTVFFVDITYKQGVLNYFRNFNR